MKLKRIGIAVLIIVLGCSAPVSYASEDTVAEEAAFEISEDNFTLNVGDVKFFYVSHSNGISADGMIRTIVDDESIIEVRSVQEEEVPDEEIKMIADPNASWYEIKGKASGETGFTLELGETVKQLAVTVTEHKNIDNVDMEDKIANEGLESAEVKKAEESEDIDEETPIHKGSKSVGSLPGKAIVTDGWAEDAHGKYYYKSGEKTKGIAEIDGVLYYFDEGTGVLSTKAQWIEKDGKKYFCNEQGELYRNRRIKFGDIYYYMGLDGSVQKGIITVDGALFYADADTGVMKLAGGWIEYGGNRYYADESGVLYNNQFINFGDFRYYMGEGGAAKKGTFCINDTYFHADTNTGKISARIGWVDDNDKKYYVKSNGGEIYVNQFIRFGTVSYYMGSDGSVQKGAVKVQGKYYYADSDSGVIQTKPGWAEHGDKKYFINDQGTLYCNQFIKFGNVRYYMGNDGSVQKGPVQVGGIYYFADSNSGVIQTEAGWGEYGGKKYFINEQGILYCNQFIKFGSIRYYMGNDGSVQKGVIKVEGICYFADPDSGIIQTRVGWVDYEGKRYFLNENGILYSNQFIKFGDTRYYMGDDGSVQRGIIKVQGTCYFADPDSGIIQTKVGWVDYEDKRYFLNENGILYSNQFIKFGDTRYYMGDDGSVQRGIIKVQGICYFADPDSGIIQTKVGWTDYEGKRYFLNENGILYSNQFIKFGNTRYYMGSDGSVQKGVINVQGNYYYADPENGVIQTKAGWIEYNGKRYFLNEKGTLYRNQFISFGVDSYYMGSDASMQTGSHYINGGWYYFNEKTGILERKQGWFTVGSNRYYQKSDGKLATGYTDIGGIRYYFNRDGVLSSKMGIDVSQWQGVIDWNAVKKAGVEFVFIRVGYRGSATGKLAKDPYYKQNIEGATAAGIKVGVYFFSQAITVAEAKEEATYTYNLIKNYNITYPVAFDAEFYNTQRTGRADKLSASTRTLMANIFCSEIRKRGYTPMIYSSTYFYRDNLQLDLLTGVQKWVAQYNSKLTHKADYKCWQYSSTGKLSGITGNVDMNVWIN